MKSSSILITIATVFFGMSSGLPNPQVDLANQGPGGGLVKPVAVAMPKPLAAGSGNVPGLVANRIDHVAPPAKPVAPGGGGGPAVPHRR